MPEEDTRILLLSFARFPWLPMKTYSFARQGEGVAACFLRACLIVSKVRGHIRPMLMVSESVEPGLNHGISYTCSNTSEAAFLTEPRLLWSRA